MVIVAGLVAGVRAVTYILVLLLLILYIYAIIAVMYVGLSSPTRLY